MRGRGVTEDRAKTLVEATHNSVGLDGGIGTKVNYICFAQVSSTVYLYGEPKTSTRLGIY